MKLYLSSQKLGNYTEKILELVGNNKNIVVIANALDDKEEEYRQGRLKKEFDMLRNIGLNPVELDLRKYFGKEEELMVLLKSKSLVWIRGGNTFILSRAVTASGFNKVIIPLIKNNEIVYAGYSAAILLANKDLLGTELVDDPNIIPLEYPKSKGTYKSLNILDFYLIPHYNSSEEWAVNVKEHVKYLKSKNEKVVTLNDGEVYYCNGKKGRILNGK